MVCALIEVLKRHCLASEAKEAKQRGRMGRRGDGHRDARQPGASSTFYGHADREHGPSPPAD